MDEKELAEIDARAKALTKSQWWPECLPTGVHAETIEADLARLIAEVRRLRAENEALDRQLTYVIEG